MDGNAFCKFIIKKQEKLSLDAPLFCLADLQRYLKEFQQQEEFSTEKDFYTFGLEPPKEESSEVRYEFIEKLGEGGMGVVELVQDHLLKRKVALKKIKIKKDLSQYQQVMLKRLKREAEITAVLEHPNIVPLYDLEKNVANEIRFTMRKVEGETLRTLIQEAQERTLINQEAKFLSIFLKVCDAVAYAHNQRVVHRDLKPENIMVGEFGEVYVMDWGIAKQIENVAPLIETEEKTEEKIVEGVSEEKTAIAGVLQKLNNESIQTIGSIGTLGYMSPEQKRDGAKVTALTDIYALGVILKECFTLLSPQEELKLRIRLYEGEGGKYQKELASIQNKIPLDIQAIVKKAMQKKGAARYQNVKELIADIEQYQKHSLVSAREYNLIELLQKWGMRNKRALQVVLMFVCLLVFSFAFFKWENFRNKENRFLESTQTAVQELKRAEQISVKGKFTKRKKINYLLNALNSLNDALLVKRGEVFAETKKLKVAEQLINICCETENYHLAHYIAKDLNSLNLLSSSHFDWKKKIETAENSILTQHLKRFEELKKILRHPKRGERESALLEISKMSENEIFQYLLEILLEGTTYHIQEGVLIAKEKEYYKTMLVALGYLENPKAGPPLIKALKKLIQHSLKAKDKVSQSLLDYMVQIVYSLSDSKAGDQFPYLHQVIFRDYRSEAFRYRTQIPYQKLFHLCPPEVLKQFLSDPFFRVGMKYNLNDFEGTIEELQNVISLYSSLKKGINKVLLSKLYVQLAKRKSKLRQFESALEDLKKASILAPQNAYLYYIRSRVKFQLGRFAEAIQDANHALILKPDYANAYLSRGIIKFEQKQFKASIQDFTAVIRWNPQHAEAYLMRGRANFELGHSKKALIDYQQAISINPEMAETLSNLGDLKTEEKKYDEALNYYNMCISMKPEVPVTYLLRANLLLKMGDLKGALEDYNEAIRLKPNYAKAYANRGLLNEKMKQLPKALADLNKAVRLQPNSAIISYARGRLFIHLGENQKAIEDFSKAIQLDPNLFKVYQDRGILFLRMGQKEKALADYNEGIRLQPKNYSIYFARGHLFDKMGDVKSALEDYNTSIRLNSHYYKSLQNRGELFLQLGQLEKAIADFKQVIQINADFIGGYNGLARSYVAQGKIDKAIEICREQLKKKTALPLSLLVSDLLLTRAIQSYRSKQFQKAKEDLIHFKKYAPKDHPKVKQIEKMLLRLEKQIK